MQQVIVDVVHLQVLQRVVVHLYSEIIVGIGEVRHFGGHKELVARMTLQGDTRRLFRPALHIDRSRVEIVHAMFDGIIHQPVHFFLINDVAVATRCRKCRPAHATITQQRHLILIGRELAVGHLADGHFRSAFAGFFLVGRTTVESRCGSHRTDADYFKEISSIHLFFLVHSLSIYKGKTIRLKYTMAFMAFHVDGTQRTGRTQVLAGSATDAACFVHCRNLQ